MWGVSVAPSSAGSTTHSPLLSLALHSYPPKLGRENKWKRILKILGSQENSHPEHETASWVLLQSILTMRLKQPQPSFTLAGPDLALLALIPVAPCTWIPRLQGQPAAAACWWHSSAPLPSNTGSQAHTRWPQLGCPKARPGGEVSPNIPACDSAMRGTMGTTWQCCAPLGRTLHQDQPVTKGAGAA